MMETLVIEYDMLKLWADGQTLRNSFARVFTFNLFTLLSLNCVIHTDMSRAQKSHLAGVFMLNQFSGWMMLTLSRLTLMHVQPERDDMLSADTAFDVFNVTWTRR